MAGIVEGGVVPANHVANDEDFSEYECKDAVECLARAEEIKANVKLMKAIRPYLEKKAKAYKSLDELRNLASQKLKEERGAADEETKQMAAQEGEMGYKRK